MPHDSWRAGLQTLWGSSSRETSNGAASKMCGPVSEGATGTVISIAAPDGRRSMLTDRGVSLGFEPDAFDPAWLDGCDWLACVGVLARRFAPA